MTAKQQPYFFISSGIFLLMKLKLCFCCNVVRHNQQFSLVTVTLLLLSMAFGD